ncbi:fimbria/pilus outer membrane usher protein [Pantoea sp. C2G6]|uniref:fimbria/pilus outer membrane usher protein n=1 Tax=Pantoea sp. C2G6 TaxID=3243084 RepID=UPI003ED9666A
MKTKLTLLKTTLICIGVAACARSHADEEFNQGFMLGSASNQSWSEEKNGISSGIYNVDIYVNKEWKGNHQLRVEGKGRYFILRKDLSTLDIKTDTPVPKKQLAPLLEDWVNLEELVTDKGLKFRQDIFQLEITVPQARIIAHDRNWMPPEQWDKGITGLFTTYNAIYSGGTYNDNNNQSNLYLTLSSGFNVADWHLRDNTYYYRNEASSRWMNRSRYLEKSLPAISSTVTAGDNYTSSPWFDSVKFRGVSLTKDLAMLPDSYRTYMPVIRGVAQTNATVKVLQDNRVVFQQSVPAGPFEFADLMPTGSRSDLTLVIENADGSKTTTIIPYSSSGSLLRSGSTDWALYAGQFKSDSLFKDGDFVQAEYTQGISNYLTMVTGGIAAGKYQSGLLGGSVLVPWLGTLTTSYQYTQANPAGEKQQGGKAKVALNKHFQTRTSVTVAASYSDKNFTTLSEADSAAEFISDRIGYRAREKSSLNLAIDQRLPAGYGSVNAGLYAVSYWNTNKVSRQFSVGWSNTYNQIAWSVNAGKRIYTNAEMYEENRSKAIYREEEYANLTLSIPWSVFGHNGTVSASSSVEGSQTSASLGWNERVSEALRYNLLVNNRNRDGASSSGYFSYASPWSTFTGNLTQGEHYTQYGAGASGTILLSQHGLLTSPQTGNHFVIIDAPGVAGAKVNGNATISTNSSGKALVPFATPWRKNTFYLTADSASDIEGNIKKIAPWKGSISYIKYVTDTRKTFSLQASNADGTPLAFGASLFDRKGTELGYVAQGGLIYVRADVLPDYILARTDKQQSCVIKNAVLTGVNICKSL